ncbi:TPA: hypothetical protein I7721_13605 [Vibrio vulnificus]|nr:hypothetical protein [Vibrio vulnificus]
MEIELQQTLKAELKEMRLCINVRDGFTCGLHNPDGGEFASHAGCVPDFFPGDHYGDYLMLNIDVETGQITNWKKPTAEDITKMLSNDD